MTTPTSTTTRIASVAEDLYAAMAAGNVAAVVDALTPDAVLHVPGHHAQAGSHVGPEAILAFVAASRAATDDGEQIDVLDVLEGREHVGVYCRVRATRAGRAPLDNTTVHLLRIEDGRVAEITLHNRDDFAVDEFWS